MLSPSANEIDQTMMRTTPYLVLHQKLIGATPDTVQVYEISQADILLDYWKLEKY